MLKDMHKAVEVAISDILKDKWQTETGQEFQLPKEAQAWVKQQVISQDSVSTCARHIC